MKFYTDKHFKFVTVLTKISMKLWWYSSQVPCYGSHLDPQSLLCSQVGSSEVAGSQDWECGLQELGLTRSVHWLDLHSSGCSGWMYSQKTETHTGCEWHWPTGLQSGWDRQKAGWLLLASSCYARDAFSSAMLCCHATLPTKQKTVIQTLTDLELAFLL